MPMEKIVVGRGREDLGKYREQGTVYIGKHIVGEGESSHLTNPVYMDVVRPHVILISGKRGSGKSYSSCVIAEEMTRLPKEIRNNLSVLMIDTMGIFWSMKNPNEEQRELLKQWNLKPEGIDIRLFVPKGFAKKYEEVGIAVDQVFTISCSDLTSMDWIITFGFSPMDVHGITIEGVMKTVKKKYKEGYAIADIVKEIEAYGKCDEKVKNALITRFLAAEGWGVFEKKGTAVNKFFQKGKVSVLDVSHYVRTSTGWGVRSMLVGLLARKIFQERLMARKAEEFEVMGGETKETIPMVWMIFDEAHQFIPDTGETAAKEPLLTLIKEGREPGISLIMITQRPNKLHPDALAQSDLVISHRLTSEADLKALRSIMQTYVLKDIQELINTLPRQKGSAIILDDNSERIYTVQVKPRLSWHAGGSPVAIKEKGLFGE